MTDFLLCSGFDHAEADGIGFLSYARVLSGSRYQGGLRSSANDVNSGGSLNLPSPHGTKLSWRVYLKINQLPNDVGDNPGVGLFTIDGSYYDTEFYLKPSGQIGCRFYGSSYVDGLAPSGQAIRDIGLSPYYLTEGEWYLLEFVVQGNTLEPPSGSDTQLSDAYVYVYVNGVEWLRYLGSEHSPMAKFGVGPDYSGYSTYYGISTNPNPPYWTGIKFGPLGQVTYGRSPDTFGGGINYEYYNTSTEINMMFDDFAVIGDTTPIGAGVSFFLLANGTGASHTMTGSHYDVSQQWYSNDTQTYLTYTVGQTAHLTFPTPYTEGARSNIRHLILNWSGSNGSTGYSAELFVDGRSLGAKTTSGTYDRYVKWTLSEIGECTPTSTIEAKITVTSFPGGFPRIYNVFLSCECATFEFYTPDENYNCVSGTYTGNGTTQEITLGFRPQFIIVAPNNAASVTSDDMIKIEAGYPWTHQFNGISPAVVVNNGKAIPVISATGFRAHGPNSTNTAGHSYSYLAIKDPGQRVLFRFLASNFPEPPKTVKFYRDFVGAQVNWTPDWIFCYPRSYAQNVTSLDSYIGPASTTSFKVSNVNASIQAGDFINNVGPGEASISTTMYQSNSPGQLFYGFQEGGFTAATQLVKCVSWTGNGATTQTISVPDVGTSTPCFIWLDWAQATSAGSRARAAMWMKGMPQPGHRYNGVAWATTEIRSVGVASFVVGGDANRNGGLYQALVLVEGTDAAPATVVVGSGGLLFAATGWPRGADIEIEHHYECFVWPKPIPTTCTNTQEQSPLSACLSPEQELFNG